MEKIKQENILNKDSGQKGVQGGLGRIFVILRKTQKKQRSKPDGAHVWRWEGDIPERSESAKVPRHAWHV